MYKLLLCWRYLRTRWIALVCVASVMLGVATMIVVNAVMAGFSHEMQTRIHGILSDLVFESHSLSGFQDPKWHMEEIARAAGARVQSEPLQGKGNVVRRMFADVEADIYVIVDGDGTYDASAVTAIIDKMLEGPHDLVNCARVATLARRPRRICASVARVASRACHSGLVPAVPVNHPLLVCRLRLSAQSRQ
jgi:hypothetical protein